MKPKKPLVLNTHEKRKKWLNKRSKFYWSNDSYLNYKPKDRIWGVELLTSNIVMLDPQLIIDEDEDEVYRLLFQVKPDGSIAEDNGYPRFFKTCFSKAKYVIRLTPEQEKELDIWFKSIKEDVLCEKDGWNFTKLQYQPLDVHKYSRSIAK